MLNDFFKTIGQLDDPRFLRVIAKSVVISLLFFALLWIAIGYGLAQIDFFQLAWLDRVVDFLGGLLVVVLTIILFPGIAIMTVGFFLEDVCAAVESRHYPHLPAPRRQSIAEVLATSARLGLTVVAINLLLLPLYLLLLFIPPANIVLFYAVNGHLLGREYFELIALRRMTPTEAHRLRRTRRGTVWLVGAAIAFLFTVPMIGLIVPGLGAAFMLHTFQRTIRQPDP